MAPYSEILFCLLITLILFRIIYSIMAYPFLFNNNLPSNVSLYIRAVKGLNGQFLVPNEIEPAFLSDNFRSRELYKFTVFSYLFYKVLNWMAKNLDILVIPLEKPKTLISLYPIVSLHYENIDFLYKYFIYSFYYHNKLLYGNRVKKNK
jgi:hypothetical protein